MSLQIYTETHIPQFHNGKWMFDPAAKKFEFKRSAYEYTPVDAIITPINPFGIQFRDNWKQKDEIVFRKKFQRTPLSHDSDVITIEDIKNVVLFSAPSKNVSNMCIDFFYTRVVDEFLNSLIVYFEYFLKTVELLLDRREACRGETGRIRDMDSVQAEQKMATFLSQHRLILAREYAKVLMS